MIEVLSLGHALIDMLLEVQDELLLKFYLKKGIFHILTEDKSRELLTSIKGHQTTILPGGSAANTAAAIAYLGGSAAFIGKVGNDEYGYFYEKETKEAGVHSLLSKSDDLTGHCIVLITPDGERTFVVHYGAARELTKDDISEDAIKNSKIIHIEGYMFDDPKTKQISFHALTLAKKHKKIISFDIADPGVVTRNRDEFQLIINDYADIIFANESEAKALTGKEPEESVHDLAKNNKIVVVKLGEHGSLIKKGDTIIKIAAVKTKVIDTTGAGDAYAAGFLHGFTEEKSLEECGKMGAQLAAKVISQIGARLKPQIIKKF